MPRENITSPVDPELRTEIGWERGEPYVQIATTNRNHQPPGGPFDGWMVAYNDRASINRAIWALRKARDEAFGVDPADELSHERALAWAAEALAFAAKQGNRDFVEIAGGWMALAPMLPTEATVAQRNSDRLNAGQP